MNSIKPVGNLKTIQKVLQNQCLDRLSEAQIETEELMSYFWDKLFSHHGMGEELKTNHRCLLRFTIGLVKIAD